MYRKLIENLSPSNFAFVMATGALALAFFKTGWTLLFEIFLFMGLVGYTILTVLFILRAYFLKSQLIDDFKDIQKMFRYLTFSAGSSALAMGFSLNGNEAIGLYLGCIGAFSFILMTYTLFCALFFHIHASIQAISPFWLLLAIASNSSGIVITTLWNSKMLIHPSTLLMAFCFWSFGVFIYGIFMGLNLFRMIFFPFSGKDMDPCYWTCMGAAAIAVVDGGQLISVINPPQFILMITPFIKGVILLLWAWGTVWIPILCLMEVWKVVYFKVPFHYQQSLWAMVFPFGMYTTATHFLTNIFQLKILEGWVSVLLWITFAVWCVVAYMSRCNPFFPQDDVMSPVEYKSV